MNWYEDEVSALERTLASRVNGTRPPVFYGSSSIRLWDSLADDFDPQVLNAGFGGATLEACDYFFERLVPPLHPRSLLVYAGDNDLGDGHSPEQVLACFHSLADKVAALPRPIPFGFVSVKPSPARRDIIDRIRHFNELVRAQMDSIPAGYYVDVFPFMVDQSGFPNAAFFLEDGLHLNRRGYRLWASLLDRYRNQIFTG